MQRSMVIGMVVFGGLGTLWGPVLGALLLYGLY
jgi:ABC-type branched-subunit amino acid transport system permease subunit